MYQRHLQHSLDTALGDTPVVLLIGARQTGKTTLVRAHAASRPGMRYLTLDDATVLSAARSDPEGFVSGLGGPAVLDEIQKAPELFPAIKASVDRDRTPGRFLLTGSANVLLLPTLSESLAGRMEVLTLWPLSFGERLSIREGFLDAVFEKTSGLVPPPAARLSDPTKGLFSGGYPEVLGRAQASRRKAWFDSYVLSILQRDVRDLANIEGLSDLPRLLTLLATRSASLVNAADLSRMIGIPLSTLRRYLALLRMIFLLVELPAWSRNRDKRIGKTPKLHLSDTGLLTSLLRMDGLVAFREDRTLLGPILETFVVMELVKQATFSRTKPQLLHFRTHVGEEVDIVLEDARGRIVGIEVKASGSVSPGQFRGLRTLAEIAGKDFVRGIVLYLGHEPVSFGANLAAWPVNALWSLAAVPLARRRERAPTPGGGLASRAVGRRTDKERGRR